MKHVNWSNGSYSENAVVLHHLFNDFCNFIQTLVHGALNTFLHKQGATDSGITFELCPFCFLLLVIFINREFFNIKVGSDKP